MIIADSGTTALILGIVNSGLLLFWYGWNIWSKIRDRKEKIAVRAVYNPPIQVGDPWIVQTWIVNVGRIPVYLASVCLLWVQERSLCERGMDQLDGKGTPMAVGDDRYFRIVQHEDDPDIAALLPSKIFINVRSCERNLAKIAGNRIVWIGAPETFKEAMKTPENVKAHLAALSNRAREIETGGKAYAATLKS